MERTTLAAIAQAADVPPGNVYYYFKTREDLIRAVIERHAEDVRELLRSLDRLPDPRERLKGLAQAWADQGDLIAAHGCPIGSLCSELNALAGGLGQDGAQLFDVILDWSSGQFTALGRVDAPELAEAMLAGIQGAALLAYTRREPRIVEREVERLHDWIDAIATGAHR